MDQPCQPSLLRSFMNPRIPVFDLSIPNQETLDAGQVLPDNELLQIGLTQLTDYNGAIIRWCATVLPHQVLGRSMGKSRRGQHRRENPQRLEFFGEEKTAAGYIIRKVGTCNKVSGSSDCSVIRVGREVARRKKIM